MSSASVMFLAVRALHVLLAAAWVGIVAFVTLFLSPALDEIGPGAGPVLAALGRRGLHAFIASIGGITVLTGIWLYWRFTGGFDPASSGTLAARVFGAGGVAGIIALILGGAVVGRNAKKMMNLGAKVASAPDAERAALITEIAVLKRRTSTFGRVVLVLQAIALVCMAIGHYV